MNQRIRELADEAAKFSAIMALPTGEAGDNLFVEKFAQLMLEECMEINRKRLIPSPLWENDEHRKSHNQALWCAISDMKELLV